MEKALSSIIFSNTSFSGEPKNRHSKPIKNSEDKKSSGSLTFNTFKLNFINFRIELDDVQELTVTSLKST